MEELVDSSTWIDYFRGGEASNQTTGSVDALIDENRIITNAIILAELLPFLRVMKQMRVASLLEVLKVIPLKIDWDEIVQFQVQCLQAGANGISIPDLIIAQNALQNRCSVYSSDKHFGLLGDVLNLMAAASRVAANYFPVMSVSRRP